MFSVHEIIEATGGKIIQGSRNARVSAVSIDSRTIGKGELFVAIKGRRFNGHKFISAAQSAGACCVMVSKLPQVLPQVPVILVKDTVRALMALGFRHRSRFNIPIVVITGSNGKTTAKEILKHLLSQKFNVLSNPGTQNNYIGASLSILKLSPAHQMAVLEIGTNRPGEIDRLSWMLQPSAAIITNIGPSHLEFLRDLSGVLKAKLELLKNLAKGGRLILNADDELLSKVKAVGFTRITFGLNKNSDFYAQDIKQQAEKISFSLNGEQRFEFKAFGRHNVYNALAGIACAKSFGLTFPEIKNALSSFQALPLRMQLLEHKNIRIVNDCYNSNPGSLACALDYLQEYICAGKKILVCGDMLELGKRAGALHQQIGRKVAENRIDFLITVGELSRNVASGASRAGMKKDLIRSCSNASQAAKFLRKIITPGDFILIKGSRAMQMESIVDVL